MADAAPSSAAAAVAAEHSEQQQQPAAAAVATLAAAAAVPHVQQKLLVSKRVFRTMERNSSTILALATASGGPQLARLALTCNELLRQICSRSVEQEALDQAEFCVKDQIMKEEGVEPITYLAKSIIAIAKSIGGLEETVKVPQPACSVKPPFDFGDELLLSPSGSANNEHSKKESAKQDSQGDEKDGLNVSGNTESSGSSADKQVDGANEEWTDTSIAAKFRPITPEHIQKARRRYEPSPPPSPARRAIMKRMKRGKGRNEDDDEEEDFHSNSYTENSTCSCLMCDTVFHAEHQLQSHLIGYHRMKPLTDTVNHEERRNGRERSTSSSAQRGAAAGVRASAAIISTRPLDSFHRRPQAISGGRPEQLRVSSTLVTSPGGTIRQYSSPSNAARAVAKANAAAAAGIMRPPPISKPYTCRQCGIVLTSQQMYASHVRYNHPKEKMEGMEGAVSLKKEGFASVSGTPIVKKLTTNGGSSNSKETAIIHLQLEDGSKAFQCRRCNKVFDSAQKVAGHSRHCLLVFEGKVRPVGQGPVPTEDRPYTVYRCGLSSELARTCPYCGELLQSIRKVDKHVRVVHEGDRHEVYGCTTCDRRFVTLGGIENHWLHYGDCPNGVLTVYRDGVATCADIGDVPPPLKKFRPAGGVATAALALGAARHATRNGGVIAAIGEDDLDEDDPSVQIVNAILGAHGFKVKNGGRNGEAPDLTPENGEQAAMDEEREDEDKAPNLLEEEDYAQELVNGGVHVQADEDDEEDEDGEITAESRKRRRSAAIVSMKVITCRLCNFASRTRDAMDMHLAEEHPDEVLAGHLESSVSPELNASHDDEEEEEDEEDVPLSVTRAKVNGTIAKTNETGEMRRLLGMQSD